MVREKPSCRNERHADGRISDAPNRIVLLDANLQSRQGEAPVRIHAHERERPRPDRETTACPNISWQPRLRGRDKPFRSIFLRPLRHRSKRPLRNTGTGSGNTVRNCGPRPDIAPSSIENSIAFPGNHLPAEQRESAANKQRLHANDGLPRPAPPRKSFRKTDIPQSGEIRYRPPFARLAPRQGKPSPAVIGADSVLPAGT